MNIILASNITVWGEKRAKIWEKDLLEIFALLSYFIFSEGAIATFKKCAF